jgi:hypothetical protein
LLVVGNKDAAVIVDLEAVRLSVIFSGERKFPRRRDLEDLAVGDVRHIEIAVAVEREPFEKAVASDAALQPDVLLRAKLVRDAGEDLGLDDRRGSVHWFSSLVLADGRLSLIPTRKGSHQRAVTEM